MKKKNLILFIVILLLGVIWGGVYWYFIAPSFGPGA